MCHIFFIHSSVEGHLGCSQVLAITNNAAMNIVEQMSLYLLISFEYMPKSRITGSCGRLFAIFLEYNQSGGGVIIWTKESRP